MAGIGFVLRKLTRKESIGGFLRAYFHAILASSGPWLLTILAIWTFLIIGEYWLVERYVEEFRAVILYNFSISLVFTAPLTMLATRYMADDFYMMDVSRITSLLIGTLSTQLIITFPLTVWFYFYVANFSLEVRLLAIINFLLISGIWLTMVFISSIKYYTAITFSFVLGMLIAIILGYILIGLIGPKGLLLGFNFGLAFIMGSFLAVILSEYPHEIKNIFDFMHYWKKYWIVALSGTCYNLGIWVDKWIMWFAPERRVLASNLIVYPDYDVAMFAAYLTIIPAMGLFLIHQETSFFEVYVRYYRGIMAHDSYLKIEQNHRDIMSNLTANGRGLFILQLSIALFSIFLAPQIMNILGMNLIQLSIFRFGILGAAFQIIVLFIMITLSYFDDKKDVLIISATFVITNTVFTLICMLLGFAFYGYGYFMSTLVTFAVAAVLAERYIRKLNYHTFVTRNLDLIGQEDKKWQRELKFLDPKNLPH